MYDLSMYPRKYRDAINAEYQYPLTNSESYWHLTRMGIEGPSPYIWCKQYAERKIQTASAFSTTSGN